MLPKSSRAKAAAPFASNTTRAQALRDATARLDAPIDEPSLSWAAEERSARRRAIDALDDENDVPAQRRKFVGQVQRRRRRLAMRRARDKS